MKQAIVEARGLCKKFNNTTVVNSIDFSIYPGRCFGMLGPNGAGKTTTLRMMLGLSPMDGGTLHIFGQAMPKYAMSVRKRMGVVPQLDNLDPDFTTAENLRIYASYFGIKERNLESRISELLHFVGLQDRADSRIASLSGGMQRRLTIARALINNPELIVLDEPTTGLDPQVRHMIWARLRELTRAGKTLILTTHYMEEAENLCDELLVMDKGKIISQGTPDALMQEHIEPEVIEIRNISTEALAQLNNYKNCRYEHVGDTLYCYTSDARGLITQLEGMQDMTFTQRPRNLEDVFLRLTGRELDE